METEEIGVSTIEELGQQREVLVRTRDRLTETDIELGRFTKSYLSVIKIYWLRKKDVFAVVTGVGEFCAECT